MAFIGVAFKRSAIAQCWLGPQRSVCPYVGACSTERFSFRGFDSRPRLQISLRFLRFSDFAN